MKIKETQYIKDNLVDYQQRIIKINDWEDYTKQFYSNSSRSNTHSMPYYRRIQSVTKRDNFIEVQFIHEWIGKAVVHRAEVVSDEEECRVISQYKDFPEHRNDFICGEFFNIETSKLDFEREYECIFYKL